MKKQLNRVLEIANKYIALGIDLDLPDGTHTDLGIVSVYYADKYETTAFEYSGIEVAFYTSSFKLPFNVTPEYLDKLCGELEADYKRLEGNKSLQLEKAKIERENQIKELQNKVKELKQKNKNN